MTTTERGARAYLTHVSEPSDTVVGSLIHLHGAVNTVGMLHESSKYHPRFSREVELGDLDGWLAEQEARLGGHFLIPGDAKWPVGVDDLRDNAPHGLWVRGDAQALAELRRTVSVAVVGARAATSYGEHVAMELGDQLTQRQIPVVSGAAYGIDGAVHRAVLMSGGITVAFLAGGAERAYPAGHSDLLRRIGERGAVVSEVPPGSTPTKWRFLTRNRLIAASTNATVVVEAGFRSGSLNTAGHAAALGRPLGAIPGPITSAASAGCHRLLREYDATCITGIDDIVQMLAQHQATANQAVHA